MCFFSISGFKAELFNHLATSREDRAGPLGIISLTGPLWNICPEIRGMLWILEKHYKLSKVRKGWTQVGGQWK